MLPEFQTKSSPSPPSMPAAMATAPALELAPEVPNPTSDPPEELRVDVLVEWISPSFLMKSCPAPPAIPVECVVAVSEPCVPPEPPNVNEPPLRVSVAVAPAVTVPVLLLWRKSSSSPPSIPRASVIAPAFAPPVDAPKTTSEPPAALRFEVALDETLPLLPMASAPVPPATPMEKVLAESEPPAPPAPPKVKEDHESVSCDPAVTTTEPSRRIPSPRAPPSTPMAVVEAPEVALPDDAPKMTVEPPLALSADDASTVRVLELYIASCPSSPAIPVLRLVAVKVPFAPPAPPKVNEELPSERPTLDFALIVPSFQMMSPFAPPRIPAASAIAPESLSAPEAPKMTVDPPPELRFAAAVALKAASL